MCQQQTIPVNEKWAWPMSLHYQEPFCCPNWARSIPLAENPVSSTSPEPESLVTSHFHTSAASWAWKLFHGLLKLWDLLKNEMAVRCTCMILHANSTFHSCIMYWKIQVSSAGQAVGSPALPENAQRLTLPKNTSKKAEGMANFLYYDAFPDSHSYLGNGSRTEWRWDKISVINACNVLKTLC